MGNRGVIHSNGTLGYLTVDDLRDFVASCEKNKVPGNAWVRIPRRRTRWLQKVEAWNNRIAEQVERDTIDYLYGLYQQGRSMSGNAMVWYALGVRDEPGKHEYPADNGDLERCERYYYDAPAPLKNRMEPVLRKYRAHIRAMRGDES